MRFSLPVVFIIGGPEAHTPYVCRIPYRPGKREGKSCRVRVRAGCKTGRCSYAEARTNIVLQLLLFLMSSSGSVTTPASKQRMPGFVPESVLKKRRTQEEIAARKAADDKNATIKAKANKEAMIKRATMASNPRLDRSINLPNDCGKRRRLWSTRRPRQRWCTKSR